MDFFITIFTEAIYRPLFNALVVIYNIIPGQDLGIAIIVLTLGIKTLFFPLSKKATDSQRALQEIQPKIKEIQKKHKDDKEVQAKKMMELWQEHQVNPLSGCLPILIQLPILLGLYRVFYNGLSFGDNGILYSFISQPENFHPFFLGLIDLSTPNVVLAVLSGFLMFVQAKVTLSNKTKKSTSKVSGIDMTAMMNSQMTYFMPGLIGLISLTLPAALPLYWIVVTLFTIGQHYILYIRPKKYEQSTGKN